MSESKIVKRVATVALALFLGALTLVALAGFVTTTREAAGALTAVPEWNASTGGWCAK